MEEFDKLNKALENPNCLNKEEILSKMKKNLNRRCQEQNFTIEKSIDSMERQELIKLNSELIAYQGQQNRDAINEEERNAQIDNNRYSQDNPYPNN